MEHKLIQTPTVKNRTAGVYQIRNTLDGKVYIGSSVNLDKRLPEHRRKLTSGRHSSPHLQSAWDKYGASNFVLEKLLVCSDKDILFYEQRLIDGYEAMNPERGYNKRLVAKSNAGMKHSEETKRRVSEGMKGRIVSAETKAKISAANLGRKNTTLSKLKMSAAQKGKKLSSNQIESRGKLTTLEVSEIRSLRLSTNATQRQLSAMFGVSRESIGEILRGETWKFTEAGYSNILPSKERKERNTLSRPRGEDHHNFGKSWAPLAARKAASIANKRPKTEEQKLKISEAKKGKKMPANFGAKMRLLTLGKTQSPETIKKRSDARANMNQDKANQIRSAYSSGVKLTSKLSEMFGISKKCVRSILTNQTWKDSLAA